MHQALANTTLKKVNDEMRSLKRNKTWELVYFSIVKFNADGITKRFKVIENYTSMWNIFY